MDQLSDPYGFCFDLEDNLVIADRNNNRIIRFKPGSFSGEIIAGGNGRGYGMNQLNDPWAVCFDEDGHL